MSVHASLRGFGLAALMCLAPGAVCAEEWPGSSPIRWYVGVAPGGGADIVTRSVAERLSKKLKTPVIVENKPGADQAIAAQFVSRAKPDGHTLLTVAGPNVHARPIPDVGQGLAPVALLSRGPVILAGASSNAPKDLRSLIAAVKAAPERWNYATAGYGSLHHIAGELFNSVAGTRMNMIPYHGGGQSIAAAVSAQVQLVVIGVGPTIPYMKADQLIGYAVAAKDRFPAIPNVPTFAELGFPDVDISQVFGVAAPEGTPAQVIDALNAAFNEVVQDPEIKDLILREGATVQPMSAAEFGKEYQAELAKADYLAKKLNVTAPQ